MKTNFFLKKWRQKLLIVAIAAAFAVSTNAQTTDWNSGSVTYTSDATFTNVVNFTANTTISVNSDVTVTISGSISGNNWLTKAGAGTLILTADNGSFTGNIYVNAGVLQIGDGKDVTASIGGEEPIALTPNAGAVIRFDVAAGEKMNLNRVIENQSGGSSWDNAGILEKRGSGALILNKRVYYIGGVHIYEGTIELTEDNYSQIDGTSITFHGNNATLDVSVANKTITNLNGSSEFPNAKVNLGSTTLTINPAGMASFGGNITGDGNIEFNTTGMGGSLTLIGTNTYTGTTTLNGGGSGLVLEIGDGGSIASCEIKLLGNTALLFSPSAGKSTSYSGVISGDGRLEKTGSGKLILTGNNSYAGATTVSDGTLQLGTGDAANATDRLDGFITGSSGINLSTTTSVLRFEPTGSLTFNRIISGSGSVEKSGPVESMLTLYGTHTYTGETKIHRGSIYLGMTAFFDETSSITLLSNDATLDFEGGGLGKNIKRLNSAYPNSKVRLGAPLTIGTEGEDDGGGVFAGMFVEGNGYGLNKTGSETFTLSGISTVNRTFSHNSGSGEVILSGTWAGEYRMSENTTMTVVGNANIGGRLHFNGSNTINMNLTGDNPSKLTVKNVFFNYMADRLITFNITAANHPLNNYVLIDTNEGFEDITYGNDIPYNILDLFAVSSTDWIPALTVSGGQLLITTQAPAITTASPLPNGKLNEAYSQTLDAEGTMPITWTLLSGALPDGLSLTSDGVVSGTPVMDGTFTFTVKAENIAGEDTKTLNITIVYFEGSGTSDDPYLISNAAELAKLAEFVNEGNIVYNTAHYQLENNIDLNIAPYNIDEGWIPIGNQSNPFKGVFDGNEKIISNLYINTSLQNAGLFGVIFEGAVKNLGLENINIRAHTFVGGVVGQILYGNNSIISIISNCYSTGFIVGFDSFSTTSGTSAGGIAGGTNRAIISNCYSTVSIDGISKIGGIVGEHNNFTKVNNCYSTGNINGEVDYIGGIAGDVINMDGVTENCAALNPSITAGSIFGRITGRVANASLSNNIAFDNMINPDGNSIWYNKGATQTSGTDISADEIYTDGTLGGRFTSDNGWTTQNGKLPGLFGNTVDMPAHLLTLPVITTTVLPDGKIGEEYNQQLTATGVPAIFTWTLKTAYTLPSGLTLSSAGLISGTPANGGTFNFTVIATNAAGDNEKTLTMFIPTPTVEVTATGLDNLKVGVRVSDASIVFTVTNGGTVSGASSTEFYAEDLPNGLNMTSWGVGSDNTKFIVGIGGTPTTCSETTITVPTSIPAIYIIGAVSDVSVTGEITLTVAKGDGVAVSGAPTVYGTPTQNSITVNAVSIEVSNPGDQSVEYACSPSQTEPTEGWQPGTTFYSLQEGTIYYIYARSAATANYNAGPALRSNEIKTAGTAVPFIEISATTGLTGLKVNQTVEANIVYTLYNGVYNNTIVPDDFVVSDLPSGLTQAAAERINDTKVTVSISGKPDTHNENMQAVTFPESVANSNVQGASSAITVSGSVTASAIAKGDVAAVNTPAMANNTTTTITLNAIDGCEYRMNNGSWQVSTTFSNLTSATSYDFQARVAETANYAASPPSSTATFSTKCTIVVSADPLAGGSVIGEGDYNLGENVTVIASANADYNFVKWTENGNQVSASASYEFTVNGNRTLVANFTLKTIENAQTPNITAHPQSATYNQNATATALAVTANVTDGGELSYQWYSNTTNNNTNGTVIQNATGTSYTPPTATAGETYYYVVVTNTNNDAAISKTATAVSNTALITVNEIPSPPVITTVDLPDGEVNKAYSVTLEATGSGTIQWELQGNMPDGLNLTVSVTGVVSGTPTKGGEFVFGVRVANTLGFDIKNFTINIAKIAGASLSENITVESKTHYSITVKAIPAPSNGQTVEYAASIINTEPRSGWQNGTTLTDLTSGMAYYVFARSKENESYLAGESKMSSPVSLDRPTSSGDIPGAPNVRVYPNPTDGMVTLEFDMQSIYHATITDLTGKVLWQQSVVDQIIQLDISNYSAGVYLLVIDSGNRQTTMRIVKE